MTDTPDPAEALARELSAVWTEGARNIEVMGALTADKFRDMARYVLEHYVPIHALQCGNGHDVGVAAQWGKRCVFCQLDEALADRDALLRIRDELGTERDELRRRIRVISGVEPCHFNAHGVDYRVEVSDERIHVTATPTPPLVHERRLELVRDTHPDHVEADATLRAYLRSQGREVPDERGLTPEAAAAHVREHERFGVWPEGEPRENPKAVLYCPTCGMALDDNGSCPQGTHLQRRSVEDRLTRVMADVGVQGVRITALEDFDAYLRPLVPIITERLDALDRARAFQQLDVGGFNEWMNRTIPRLDKIDAALSMLGPAHADLAAKSAQLTDLIVELAKDVQALAGKMEGGE